jgi:hypothetical protein
MAIGNRSAVPLGLCALYGGRALLGHFPEQTAIRAVRGGGVVDEHVDAAELRERVRDEALRVGGWSEP